MLKPIPKEKVHGKKARLCISINIQAYSILSTAQRQGRYTISELLEQLIVQHLTDPIVRLKEEKRSLAQRMSQISAEVEVLEAMKGEVK